MKKVLFAISAFALLMGAASCQDELGGKIDSSVKNPLNTITVKMGGADTRLGLDGKSPYFEEGDQVFGWDADGNYTYQCTSVSGTEATFSRTSEYAPSADEGTKVNLVFANGFSAEDVTDGTLAIDITLQNAASFEELPVVMTASGAVDADGKCSMSFTNETSVIKVTDCVTSEEEGAEFESIAASNLFPQMTISIDADGNMVKTPGTTPGTITNKGGFTAGADGKISTCIATFPTQGSATEISFSARTSKDYYYEYSAGSKTVKSNTIVSLANKTFSSAEIAVVVETSTIYGSLATAIAAANESASDCTVRLLDDCATASTVTINNTNGKKVTLDLNGNTIVSTAAAITVKGDTDIIGNGGTITSTGSYAVICNAAGVTVNINGGNYNGCNEYGAIRHYGSGSVMTIDGNPNVTNTSSNTSYYAINNGYDSSSSAGELIIKNGVFTSAGSAIRNAYGTVKIADGTFIGGVNSAKSARSSATVEIAGGNFYAESGDIFTGSGIYGLVESAKSNKPIQDQFLASGLELYELGTPETIEGKTFLYGIRTRTAPVARLTTSSGSTDYLDVTDAFKAALTDGGTCTVKLMDNCALSEKIDIAAGDITLDLNGCDFVVASTNRVDVSNNNAKFSVCSTNGKGTYTQNGTGDYYLTKITGGSFVAENVDFITTASSSAIYVIPADTTTYTTSVTMKDCSVTTAKTKGFEIYRKKTEVTLDNVNVTVNTSNVADAAGDINALYIGSQASVTVKGGSYKSTSTTMRINNRGHLTITDGCSVITENASSEGYALYIDGANKANMPNCTLTVDGGSKITSDSRCLYTYYCNCTFDNCEFTSNGTINTYCVYIYTGASCEFKSGCSIVNKSATREVFRSGSSNANTNIKILGGHYYGNGKILNSSSATTDYTSKVYISGGYFNKPGSAENYGTAAFGNAGTFSECSETHTHGGTSYSYGYKVN